MTTAPAHSLTTKQVKPAYPLRSAKGLISGSLTKRTHCMHRAFCPYILRSRKRSLCSCEFCVPEESVGSNTSPVAHKRKATPRNTTSLAFIQARARDQAGGSGSRTPTAAEERAARMQVYEQFQRFMAERPRQVDNTKEIRSCIDQVEAMDCTEIQKMLGGVALGKDSMRAVFMSWPYERKLIWLKSLGN